MTAFACMRPKCKPSAFELIGPRSAREEIRGVYNDVYQLWRSPSKSPCDGEMEERTYHEILDCIKECLQHRQNHTQPEEEPRQSSTGTSRPDPQAEFQHRMHTMYDHYIYLKGIMQRSPSHSVRCPPMGTGSCNLIGKED